MYQVVVLMLEDRDLGISSFEESCTFNLITLYSLSVDGCVRLVVRCSEP